MKTIMKMNVLHLCSKITSIVTLILVPVVLVFFTGCASMQDDAIFASSGMARLQIVTKTGSGKGSTVSTVYSVDDNRESVDVDKTYVLVTPGFHTIAFNYYQVVDPGGGMDVSVEILGVHNDLLKSRPGEAIKNIEQIKVGGRFEVGKTYWIDSSSLVFKVYNPYPNSVSMLGMYALTGDVHIREKKSE